MRPLRKGPKPEILRLKGPSWTTNYVNAQPGVERKKKERWRHPEIKTALKQETQSKCAYCEGQVDDVAFPHVEHILPKQQFPELAHYWENLTSACERCNNAKDNYYDPRATLINPYQDRVTQHLNAAGALVDWVKGDIRGETTVTVLGLNRADLVLARARRMLSVRGIVERWHASAEPLKSTLATAITLDAREGEFTQTVENYLRELGFPLPGADSGVDMPSVAAGPPT